MEVKRLHFVVGKHRQKTHYLSNQHKDSEGVKWIQVLTKGKNHFQFALRWIWWMLMHSFSRWLVRTLNSQRNKHINGSLMSKVIHGALPSDAERAYAQTDQVSGILWTSPSDVKRAYAQTDQASGINFNFTFFENSGNGVHGPFQLRRENCAE